MEKNIFEIATKNKYRYPFHGTIATEDLFDLRPEDLDVIFKMLNSQVKKVNEESLLSTKSRSDEELENKIEIVKHVFAVKQAEKATREKAKENKEKKQRLMAILADKKDKELQGKSVDELEALIRELD